MGIIVGKLPNTLTLFRNPPQCVMLFQVLMDQPTKVWARDGHGVPAGGEAVPAAPCQTLSRFACCRSISYDIIDFMLEGVKSNVRRYCPQFAR